MKRVMVFFVLLLSCQVMICGQTKIDIRKVLQEADPWETSGYVSLGWCYVNGYGVPQDYREAVRWWSRAAEQGNEVAQVCLEWCYENGYGVPQNYKGTETWHNKSVKQGNAEVQRDEALEIFVTGYNYFNDKNYTEAVKCFKKAAELGNSMAQCTLGSCYDMGLGVTKNFTKAMHWYRQAAEQGDPMGQFLLGNCYEGGIGGSRDFHTAAYWYKKAAEQGNDKAQFRLGGLYILFFQDMEQALYWLRKAAAQGNKDAIGALKKIEEMQ